MKIKFGKCKNKRTEQIHTCLQLHWGGWFVVDDMGADPSRLKGPIFSPDVFKDYYILIDDAEVV